MFFNLHALPKANCLGDEFTFFIQPTIEIECHQNCLENSDARRRQGRCRSIQEGAYIDWHGGSITSEAVK